MNSVKYCNRVNRPIEIPVTIIAKDHIEKLSVIASERADFGVVRIMYGKVHTCKSINPSPQVKKLIFINNRLFHFTDSIIKNAANGMIIDDVIKKGFNVFPFINIPKGNAKNKTPKNLYEVKLPICSSKNPIFLKYIFKIKIKDPFTKFSRNIPLINCNVDFGISLYPFSNDLMDLYI